MPDHHNSFNFIWQLPQVLDIVIRFTGVKVGPNFNVASKAAFQGNGFGCLASSPGRRTQNQIRDQVLLAQALADARRIALATFVQGAVDIWQIGVIPAGFGVA
jgi:hypothetical protein